MNRLLSLSLALAASALLLIGLLAGPRNTSVYAQQGDAPTPTPTTEPGPVFDIQILPTEGKISPPKYPNLDSDLNHIIEQAQTGRLNTRAAAANAPMHREESVAVTLYITEGYAQDVWDYLEQSGASPRNIGADHIEAYIPVSLLAEASEQESVLSIRTIIPPHPDQGTIVGGGVAAHGVPSWHAAGYKGRGVKIGVIDFSFEGFAGLMGSELPATVNARCYTGHGSFTATLSDCITTNSPESSRKHGTAVTEAVFDIAPQAEYYIADPGSYDDLLSTVNWMVSQGVDVINMSLGWTFNGPGDGTTPYSNAPLKSVDAAVTGGIIWVNSAGNSAKDSWHGAFSDSDSDGIHQFNAAGNECNIVTIDLDPLEGFRAQLRWADSWGGASKSLDLYLIPVSGGTLSLSDAVATSERSQSGGGNHIPYETIRLDHGDITNGEYCLAVNQASGDAPSWIQLLVWGASGDLQNYVSARSIGNPAESRNSGMLAAGAARYSSTSTIESFSSQGPTTDDRTKPDIVGADGGTSSTYGTWYGTSQASPHVAGLAALVKERFPSYSPSQIATYLKSNALARGTKPNNKWGHGFAKLPTLSTPVPLSTDTTLSALTLSDVDFGTFSSGTESYTASVTYSVSQTTVTPAVNDSGASYVIKLDGVNDSDGTISLVVGSNVITIEVKAEDGDTTKTYRVTVTRAAASTDARLSGLTLSDVDFGTFSSGTESYTASVADTVPLTTVTPTLNDSEANFVIKLDGVIDSDGAIPLGLGQNVITIEVTAEDDTTTKTYTVTVTRALPPSTDATLKALTLSDVNIGAFSSGTTSYTASVANGVTHTTVTPTLNDSEAIYVVKLGGMTDSDGTVSLTVGSNVITVEVTAEDGSTKRTYSVTLTRAAPVSAQGSAPDTPDQPVGTAVFVGGVDLEWNDVPGADSYDVQLFRNGQWADLPGDGVEITFYGAGAIISELDPGSTHWFQVRARNAHGSSDWSNFRQVGSTNQSALGKRARPDNAPASGAPVIDGTAQVGESLTADTTGIEDGNGLDRVQFRFQWVSNDGSADTDIASATDSTYTLAPNDEGKTIKVRVAFTDRGGYAESLTGVGTELVTSSVQANPAPTPEPAQNSPATGAPTISGTPQVGQTLTSDTSGISDSDGLTNVTYGYQWIANDGTSDTDIAGATDSTYTLVAADEGGTIKVRVSFTDDAANAESLTSAATATVDAAPNSPATGAPTISGTAQVGETLTADTSGIADADGLTNVTYGYQWIANDGTSDTAISGATNSTYTLVAADEGGTIKVRVSFTDDAGNDETLTSAATAAVDAAPNSPATGAPTITGTAQVGETLTAATSGIADADGLTNVSYSYQWIANDGTSDTAISGATNSTYTLVAADEGKTIKVRVSFTDAAGHGETLTSAATASVAARSDQGSTPDTPDQPVGTAVFVGGVDLEWNDVPGADSYDVQLFRNGQWMGLPGDGVEITFYGAGAILSELDPGSTHWFQVRARNAHGSSDWSNFRQVGSTNQSALGKRARPDNVTASGVPVIDGTAQVGESLTADTTGIEDGNGLDRVQFRLQWVSNDGSADAEITGATGSSYTLVAADEGKTVKVRVSFTDRGGYAESLTSAATDTVSFAVQQQVANNPATGAPAVNGNAQVGETLTADTSGIADADGLTNVSYSYQWIANDGTNDTDITEATDSGYILADADEGRTIKVKVSFTDDAGHGETLTSAATAAVDAAPHSPATGAPTITGTAQVGETLTAATSGIADADGLTNVSYSYQWIANDGTSDTAISGATNSTYTLVNADEGGTIKVRVSFTDDAGNDETLTSGATATVGAAPNSPATGAPGIIGTAQVGETLTAATSGIADADGLANVAYGYQWIANDGTSDTAISGATNSTYTLIAADEGKTIKVRVSFTDDAGHGETLTSAATASVAALLPLTVSLENNPATHNGTDVFTFEIRFSEEFPLSFRTLKVHALQVTGGTVKKARRVDNSSDIHWRITVRPDADGNVSIVLPVTDDCDDQGAICTRDGRKLSNGLEFTVVGPGG